MKIFSRHKNNGFTLVEMMIAISIFTTSLIVVMGVLSQSLSSTSNVRKRMIATYLAQEGIEYIHNLRDTYVLYTGTSSAGWTNFNTKVGVLPTNNTICASTNGCYFNADALNYTDNTQPMIDITFTACAGTCTGLLYDSSTGVYGYTTGAASGYTRKITANSVNANETKITSTVSWTQGSGNYSVVLSENVFNWVE